jgi:hypothetical protein
MPKKSTKEFISDVIIPIEQNGTDSGNLYVLIRSLPNQSCTEYGEERLSSYEIEDWSFPTESSSGEWIESKQKWLEASPIELATLSGIIWRGVEGGRLYKADFEGEKKKVDPNQYWGSSDYARRDIDARQHIDRCISLGLKVKRARLIRIIKNWRPYLLWSFALDCIERAYSYERDLVPDIYKQGIIFARAYSKYRCGMGGIELEGWVEASSADKNFYSLSLNKKYELIKLISANSDFGAPVYLKKAILEAFEPYKPFQAANYVRTAMAWHDPEEYHKEYAYPSLATQDPEEQKISYRIWYALHKKELDWQVDHMSKLIGE